MKPIRILARSFDEVVNFAVTGLPDVIKAALILLLIANGTVQIVSFVLWLILIALRIS